MNERTEQFDRRSNPSFFSSPSLGLLLAFPITLASWVGKGTEGVEGGEL